MLRAIELFRRWFVKVEYRCEKCDSRFTLLKGEYLGISTGTYYRIRCLICGTNSENRYPYFRGQGKQCGLSFMERWTSGRI